MKNFLFNKAGDPGDGGQGDGSAGTPPPPAATTRHEWLNDDLSFSEGWQDKLPEDSFKDYKATLANYRDLPSLAKALKESKSAAMQRLDGMVKIPAADAPPEEWQTFYRQAGAPEKAEEYEVPTPEGEIAKYFNADRVKDFQSKAHELGLTKKQAEALAKWQLEGVTAEDAKLAEEGREALKQREAKLRETWGSDYDKRMADVQRVAMTFNVNPADLDYLPPEWTLGFAKIAAAMSEDKLVSSEQVHNKLSPLDRARSIMTDPKSPYNDRNHPRHKETVEEVNRLYSQAFPE